MPRPAGTVLTRTELERPVTIRQLIRLAADLKSDGDNPEYDRALVELIVDAARLSMDERERIADLLGVQRDALTLQTLP